MNSTCTHNRTANVSEAALQKLLLSHLEAEDLNMRDIHCPYCSYLIERVYSDVSGHKEVYCQKCKRKYVINFGYFRRQKKFKYFCLTAPEDNKKRFIR